MRYRIYVLKSADSGDLARKELTLSGYHYHAIAESPKKAREKFVNIIKRAPEDTSHMTLHLRLNNKMIARLRTGVPYKISDYGDYPVYIHRIAW